MSNQGNCPACGQGYMHLEVHNGQPYYACDICANQQEGFGVPGTNLADDNMRPLTDALTVAEVEQAIINSKQNFYHKEMEAAQDSFISLLRENLGLAGGEPKTKTCRSCTNFVNRERHDDGFIVGNCGCEPFDEREMLSDQMAPQGGHDGAVTVGEDFGCIHYEERRNEN